MEETIKGIEVIAYKGMNSDMSCRDFKYELGKSYKTDKVELCECGFHACLNPRDVYCYYKSNNYRYFKVKLSGEITKCYANDTKVAATEITILEEVTDNFDKIVETTEWWKQDGVLDLLYNSEDFARIRRGDGLWNFIDKNGKILSDEWFKDVYAFFDGLAKVKSERFLYNFIDKQGKLLSNEWFQWCDNFYEGYARVQRGDGLWNLIDKQGKILSDEWFRWCDNFSKGSAVVRISIGDYYKIDETGNLWK